MTRLIRTTRNDPGYTCCECDSRTSRASFTAMEGMVRIGALCWNHAREWVDAGIAVVLDEHGARIP